MIITYMANKLLVNVQAIVIIIIIYINTFIYTKNLIWYTCTLTSFLFIFCVRQKELFITIQFPITMSVVFM